MRIFLLAWLVTATTAFEAGALPASPGSSPAAPHPRASRPPAGSLSPDALFSRRALRRAKLLIQMQMMQLREERLECLRAALARRLPQDLLAAEPQPDCEEMLKF